MAGRLRPRAGHGRPPRRAGQRRPHPPLAVGVLFDPFLGVLSVLAIYFLGRELAGRAAGLGGAAVAAVLPILTGYSMVGRIDHHAIEPALVAFPLALLVHGLRGDSGGARSRAAVGLGLVLAAGIGVWPGAIAAGVLAAAFLAVVALWTPGGCDRSAILALGRRAFGVATLVVVPIVLAHPWAAAGGFAYFAPTWLQPLMFATAWLSFALAGVMLRRRPATCGALAAALLLTPLTVAAAGVVLFPELRHTVGSVLGYLDRGDVQISQVFESYPLLSFGLGTAVQQYGVMALALPLLLVALGLHCWGGTPSSRLVARGMLLCFVVTAGMALSQLRLGSQFAPLWWRAVGLGVGGHGPARRGACRAPQRGPPGWRARRADDHDADPEPPPPHPSAAAGRPGPQPRRARVAARPRRQLRRRQEARGAAPFRGDEPLGVGQLADHRGTPGQHRQPVLSGRGPPPGRPRRCDVLP